MGKQAKYLPEEDLDEQPLSKTTVGNVTTTVGDDGLDEQPITLKKKEPAEPSGEESLTPGKPSKQSGASEWEAIGQAIKVVAPGAKPIYDFGRRMVAGIVDDVPAATAQALEVAKSSVASPANVQEFVKTQRPIDFQKYVRGKEGMKWYERFDINKYTAKYADSFMEDTGLQDIAKKINENKPKVVERRAKVEEFVARQKGQSAEKLAGTVQSYKDIKSIDDVLSFVGTMGGQAAYQIPLAIATRGGSSLIQESAAVYDQQIENIAKEKGITRKEVIAQNLDEPVRGQQFAILAASLDAVSAGNILKVLREGAKDNLLKRWAKSAVPETITEPTQGVIESVGAATGSKWEAAGKALKDPNRINEALGGLIGGSAGVFGASPAQTVEAVTQNVDATDEQTLAAKAEVIQAKVEQQQEAVVAGDIDAQPTTPQAPTGQPPIPVPPYAQTPPVAPQPEPTQQEPGIPEDQAEEEVQAPSDEEVEEAPIEEDPNQPKTLPVEEPTPPTTEAPVEGEPAAPSPASLVEKVEESMRADAGVLNKVIEEERKRLAREQIDALVESGDLKRDGKKVTVVTEKGAKELKRIVEEQKIKKTDAVQEPSPESVDVREQAGDGGAVGEGNIQPEAPQESQGEKVEPSEGQGPQDLTFTKTIRGEGEVGGIKGVPAYNQFKFNQGVGFERVQVVLSDEQAELYQRGSRIAKGKGRTTSAFTPEMIAEALDFVENVKRIARENRQRDREVTLDFRPQKPTAKPAAAPAPTPAQAPPKAEAPKQAAPPAAAPPKKAAPGETTPQDVHSAATAAGVDYNTDEFKKESKNVTGKEHLDDMTPKQLDEMIQYIKSAYAPPKPAAPSKPAEAEKPAEPPPPKKEAPPPAEEEREEKERTTYTRVKNDPKVSKEIKQGVSEEGKNYVPRNLKKVTEHEADTIITVKGTDESIKMFLADDTGMYPDVEVAIGIKLFQRLQAEGKTEDAIRVLEKLSIRGTELGQAVNAFKLMQGDTAVAVVQKTITKARQAYKERHESKFEKAKKEIDDINKKAADQVLKSEKFKAKVASEAKKGGVKKAIDFLEGLKVDTKGKALDIAYGITAAAWNTVITAVQKGLQAGLTISQAINKAVNAVTDPAFTKKEATEFLNEQLKGYVANVDPTKAIKAELAEQGRKIEDIVKEHYTEQQSTKKDLIDKLVKDANIPADQAQALVDELSTEFDKLTKKAKEKALNKILPKPSKGVSKKEKQSAIDKLIEQSNIGALSEDQYADTIANQIGVPSLTPEQLKKIKELTDAIQAAKGDTAKAKAGQDLMNYIEGLKGWNWMDAAQAIWYANILSGPSTWLVTNPFANFTNLVAELGIDIAKRPGDAAFILSRVGVGLARGLVQAGDVLTTGYNPTKGQDYKTEATPLLERINFKGDIFNPLNWLKYVTRAIKAGDILFYHPLKQQRLAVEALKEAKKNGRKTPNKDDMHNLKEQLLAEDYDAALQQAEDEGFSGREQKIRAYEILEEKLPEYATVEAERFAARATFNIKPEGTLGVVAQKLNSMRADLPVLNYVVPFVNTIMNVANEYMNYNPIVGFARIVKGSYGWNPTKSTYRKLTAEEKASIAIKSGVASVLMAALAALDDPDDPESLIEITANGTGDLRKNYELEKNGWREYSVRVGKTWFSYKNTPFAMPMAMVGFVKDAQRYSKKASIKEEISILAMGSFRFLMDLSALSGLAEFIEIFTKDDISQYENAFTKFIKYTEKTAKSMLIPNYFTQMSRLIQEFTDNPTKRARELGESIYRDIPILRDNLDNMYDAFGDPVVARQIEKLIPLNLHRSPADTEMVDFLADKKLFVGAPSRQNLKPNGTPMTEKEYNDWSVASAKAIKRRINREYKMYSREKNNEVVKSWFDKVKREERKNAKYEVFGFF